MAEAPLAGAGILVTRPAHQARGLVDGITDAGGKALSFPVIEIREAEDRGQFAALGNRIGEYDWFIFVSPNAVEMAMRRLDPARFPPGLRFAVVGQSSAKALQKWGIEKVFLPANRFDSEGLLELPELSAVSSAKIAIFRGNGGREHLGDELQKRGAEVDYVECYRRMLPESDAAPIREAWERGALSATSATSGESVENLLAIAGDWVKRLPLFVPHRRIKELAERLGFSEVVLTPAGDEGLLFGMIEWFALKRRMHGNG